MLSRRLNSWCQAQLMSQVSASAPASHLRRPERDTCCISCGACTPTGHTLCDIRDKHCTKNCSCANRTPLYSAPRILASKRILQEFSLEALVLGCAQD